MNTKRKMRVLVACEESQEVTKAFRARGHEAYSCDLQDCSGGFPEWHIKGDAISTLYSREWDLVIAHPPCTILSNSGVRWLISMKPKNGYVWMNCVERYVNPKRLKELMEACTFFNEFILYFKKGGIGSIENPIQHNWAKQGLIEDYDQLIQPYQFGHTEKKATCLWLYSVPPLVETNNVYDEMMALPYAERAKVHYASPGPERAKLRSKTYTGIAKAMAEQWG